MHRQVQAGLFFMTGGLILAYVLAHAWASYRLGFDLPVHYLLTEATRLFGRSDALATELGMIFFAGGAGGLVVGSFLAGEALSRIASSSWQTISDMRRNRLLKKPGKGFIVAKTTGPKLPGRYIGSDKFPNCLVIAPTGAGKGVGFMYPNLLTYEGSTITLDIKGENYETTARWRAKMGDKIIVFAPAEFHKSSARYNPLDRIARMTDYAEYQFALRKTAGLFLQAEYAGEWLNGAIQLFTAIGCIAQERKRLTLGDIHAILAEGGKNLQSHIQELAKQAREPALQRELSSLGRLENKTLATYLSVMNNAGFDLWSNPHVARMTASTDFTFDNIRRELTSIYFIIKDGDIKPLAGLVRLFFNDLITTMQASLPDKTEPHGFMLILDEFHRLGKMEQIADAMTTIRGFGGRIAIVTQTIPKLDQIYSREERLSIQGGAGLKLYLTPSEEMTIEDVSKACGKTNKRIVSKSRRTGFGEKTTISERMEEHPLLTEDEARRLDPNAAIVIINGQQPILAKRIIHFEDRRFTHILKEQDKLSWAITEANKVEALEQRVIELEAAQAPQGLVAPDRPTRETLDQLKSLLERLADLFDKTHAMPKEQEQPTVAPVLNHGKDRPGSATSERGEARKTGCKPRSKRTRFITIDTAIAPDPDVEGA
jgi:type IV secretion system protein VirD4